MIITHMVLFNFWTGATEVVPPLVTYIPQRGFMKNPGRFMGT